MVTVNHSYDPMGRRISSTVNNQTTLYAYDGWNVVEEYAGSAAVSAALARIYTWGLDLSGTAQGAGGVGGLLFTEDVINNTAWHHHCDGNGNVTHLTNASGQTVATYTYDAFGNSVTATGTAAAANKYRFSTKPIDETIASTPLYYYGYRFYNPLTGRWINRDPIEEKGGLNLYGFVGNDGVGKIDVLGESPDFPDCCKEEEKAVDKARKDYIKKFDDYDKARTAHQKAMADAVSSSIKSLITTAAAGLACAKCIATKSPWDCRACALASIAAAAALYDHHQKVMDEIGKGIDKGIRKGLADKAYKDYDKAMRDRDDCWKKADPRCFCAPIEPPPSPIFL